MKEGIFITKISFKIDGEPKGKGRPRFGKGSTYTPTETKDYEHKLVGATRRSAVASGSLRVMQSV
ncbi:hypothetical protein DWX94_04215 [Coprococcus eutactus]|uniref:Uncharacterized protein n=1 Tax=Coprococcus eutactus TaxID=33043 RepID=A0A3R5WSI7_9FIRM|nr:hypothetical protein DWX94_04215 [Coprococcus eutactus]